MGERFAKTKYSLLLSLSFFLRIWSGEPVLLLLLETCLTLAAIASMRKRWSLCLATQFLSAIVEEAQPALTRMAIMSFEFQDNMGKHSLVESLPPMLMHALSIYLNQSILPRICAHLMYNILCVEFRYRANSHDHRGLHTEPVDGVYQAPSISRENLVLAKSLEYDSGSLYKTENLLFGKIHHGRARLIVKNTRPGAIYPEFLPMPGKDHAIGIGLGVDFGLVPRRCGVLNLAAIRNRLAPQRIAQTNPIKYWVESYISGEMPPHNPRFEIIMDMLMMTTRAVGLDGKPFTQERLLKSLEEDTWRVDAPSNLVELIMELHKLTWNDFHCIYEKFFAPLKGDFLKHVKPMTIRQVISQASCSRIRAKYEKEVERRGMVEGELDSTFIMRLPRDGNAGVIFSSKRARTIPIFVKNEKYSLKDQYFSEDFLEMCRANGIYPHIPEQGPHYKGFKPRVISAVPMGVPEEGVLGGQFLMCFYSSSIKAHVSEILSRPRTIVNDITMERKSVIFHFITNTRSVPVECDKGRFWSTMLNQPSRQCIGKSTSEVLRRAYDSARISGVINVLIHGDDSLMIYPIEGESAPLFIECDYSSYDTSQADDAIAAEHRFYTDWFIGLPDGFVTRSESHHSMPFSFSMGKEFPGFDRDHLMIKVILDEAMRLSGGWNTTIGNSLVSAMIILYVIGTCSSRKLRLKEPYIRERFIPKFDTYSDLRVRVKKEAFSYSFDPRHMSFLKMGIALTQYGLTFVLLPSRCLRAFALLTVDVRSLERSGQGKLRHRVNEILFETFHGYTVQSDFPILGVLYSSLYWTLLMPKILNLEKMVTSGSGQDYDNPSSLMTRMRGATCTIKDMVSSPTHMTLSSMREFVFKGTTIKFGEENVYSPTSSYNGSFKATRHELMDMVLTRYNGITGEVGLIESHHNLLNEQHIIQTEKMLTAIDGLRTYWVKSCVLVRLGEKDYSVSSPLMCAPSWF